MAIAANWSAVNTFGLVRAMANAGKWDYEYPPTGRSNFNPPSHRSAGTTFDFPSGELADLDFPFGQPRRFDQISDPNCSGLTCEDPQFLYHDCSAPR